MRSNDPPPWWFRAVAKPVAAVLKQLPSVKAQAQRTQSQNDRFECTDRLQQDLADKTSCLEDARQLVRQMQARLESYRRLSDEDRSSMLQFYEECLARIDSEERER
eukprot:RCo012121